MNIAVFGATGAAGREVVDQALHAGHRVTAVVRNASTYDRVHPELRVVTVDLASGDSVRRAIAGQHAVLSVLGPRKKGNQAICSEAVSAIIPAMERESVRRLVVLSAAPVNAEAKNDSWIVRNIAKPILWRVFREHYEDLTKMEALVRSSGLLFSIFRPPRLTNGHAKGHYRQEIGDNVAGGSSIARSDLATALLNSLDDTRLENQAIGIAY